MCLARAGDRWSRNVFVARPQREGPRLTAHHRIIKPCWFGDVAERLKAAVC